MREGSRKRRTFLKSQETPSPIAAQVCSVHHKLLVCPTCQASARGKLGGRQRAKNLTRRRLSEIGKQGGRPVNEERIETPASVVSPLSRM